jgi:rhomboid family GlyGly-CTERM serine protease
MNTSSQPADTHKRCSAILQAALTWSIALTVVVVHFVPAAAQWLQYDRQVLLAGQWWRFLTGHLVHWNTEHLVWDLLMFVVLGYLIERQSRCRLLGLLLGSATAISSYVWCVRPDVVTYRGLSGIDTALFVYLAAMLVVDAVQNRQLGRGLAAGMLLASLASKLFFESATGGTLFVNSNAAGFGVLIEAHLLGALVGVLVVGLCCRRFPAAACNRAAEIA